MIARRTFLAAPLVFAAARARAGVGEPAGGRLGFSIVREGSEIGTHRLDFRRSGSVLEVGIEVRMAIGIGPITLFRYRHAGVEVHRQGKFAELETTTDHDGEPLHVVAKREDTGIVVDSSKLGRRTMPAEALPLTHWNIANMSALLFNPQDGKPMQLTVTPRGATRVALASGASVTARGFSLTGEATLDDWYDSDDVWTALRAVASDGSVLDYRRIG